MMQADPTDTDNDCYHNTVSTNAEILVLADFEAYTLGGFDFGTFADQFQVMGIYAMQQVESCNFTQFLIAGDALSTNLPNAISALANLVTQIGTGWSAQDTSVFISLDKC